MTRAQVLKEVTRRWGKNGQAQSMANGVLHVGRVMMGLFFEVKGSGKTWEEAFADADAKVKADHERFKADQKRLGVEQK